MGTVVAQKDGKSYSSSSECTVPPADASTYRMRRGKTPHSAEQQTADSVERSLSE